MHGVSVLQTWAGVKRKARDGASHEVRADGGMSRCSHAMGAVFDPMRGLLLALNGLLEVHYLWHWPDFHQRVMTAALDPRSELVSAQDASFIPKSGKHTFGLGHFFNGCASRAERGLEISTVAVVDVTRRCAFTLAVAQTPPGKEKATPGQPAEDETRIDFYKQQLHDHRHRLPPTVTYHCVDGYFAKKKYIDEVVDLKLHPITKLRHDANCRFLYTGPHPKRRGRKRKYDGKVNFHDLEPL